MGTRNKLSDLNNHLFCQLERLNNESLKGEMLEEEIQRAKAVTLIATKIIDNGALVLRAQQFIDSKWNAEAKLPKMLEG